MEKISFDCIFHVVLEGCILWLIYNSNSHLSLLFFSGWFLGGFRRYPHVLAMVSVAVINWGVFSGQGPPWSLARGWLLRSHFFIVAAPTGCYDDKATFVSTSSETMFPETIILVSGFFRNRLRNSLLLNKNRNVISIAILVLPNI